MSRAILYWIISLSIITAFNLSAFLFEHRLFSFILNSIIRLFRILSIAKMGFPKEKVFERVKMVRSDICGHRRGAPKRFAEQVLQMPYTTYLEYEKNIVDLDFLQMLADRFDYRIEWLVVGQGLPKKP